MSLDDGEGFPDDLPDEALVRVLPVINKRGLHARASAKFVQCVETYEAQVYVSRAGETVNGTSIMGLMMLSAAPGTSIRVAATGHEAEDVLIALQQLIEDKFGEEE